METVTSDDGTRIAFWRSGTGPPLLLVHGTTATHARWSHIVSRLEDQFTVYAMDRRGRGGSGDADEYSMAREAEDLTAVIDAIAEPVNLVGHSYGGICSLEAALRTAGVRRMVLYEPAIPVGYEIVPANVMSKLEELIDQGEREAALAVFFREVVHVSEEQIAMLRAHPAWPGRVAAAHTILRESRIEAEYRLDFDRLRTLQVPTLMLLGGDSPPFLRESTMQVHAALPGSRIHEMPGQQHVAMDAIPDEFAGILRAFFTEG
jgi:pimeloyl-ACP methyl ester carboxylesterase